MATINGVTFNMQNLRPMAVHRNSISEQPGSDTNFITNMGYDGLVLRLEGYEETLATYDSVISEFMKSGEQTLVHRTGWQFSVYSAQLTPELIAGFADNYFPYDLILYTSTPYRESTILDCRVKEITTNNQEWSAEDMPCNNLLDNWSFEDWAGGPSAAPDGWVTSGTAPTIAREDTIIKTGTYSIKLTANANNSALKQSISNYSDYKGQNVTVGMWIKASNAGARIFIVDGSGYYYSSHSGGGDWEFITKTITVDAAADKLEVHFTPDNVTGSNFAYFDGAVLVEGDSIPDNTFIRDIDTDGSVDAVPDIKVTGGAAASSCNRTSTYSDTNTDATEYINSNTTWTLEKTHTFTANSHYGWILNTVGMDLRGATGNTGYGKVSYQAASLNGGAETDVPDASWSKLGATYSSYSEPDIEIQCAGNEDLVVKFYLKSSSGLADAQFKNLDYDILASRQDVCKNPEIYNTADTTVKSEVANEIDPDMVFSINTDGTGTIEYADDFTTDKYLDAHWELSGVTHDTGDDELDIADDGYLSYKEDTKHTVAGVPTLTTQINITSGTPTIQISSDDSTWYDITTAIVDDVDTVYDLDSSNLSLKGLTEFYWRVDCVKAAAATCSIKNFELDIMITTIDVEHPKISSSGVSTFRCDQHADSGLNCEISLSYRDRSWPA